MKKILIVFTDIHLAYSPSTLNLFQVLKEKGFEVTLLSAEPQQWFSTNKVEEPGVVYVKYKPDNKLSKVSRIFLRNYYKIKSKVTKKQINWDLSTHRKSNAFVKKISENKYDDIIAVDFLALWCVEQTGQKAHFLSLEIVDTDIYKPNTSRDNIKSVLIQSQERYDYLFGGSGLKYSIFPNSPFHKDLTITAESRNPFQLVYCGSATFEFGFISCLDFLCDYKEYSLTVIGAVPEHVKEVVDLFYKHLLADGRLILDKTYYTADQLPEVVSKFRIGLVFYDFYRFKNMRAANYYMVPSGKLYQYFNAGVPAIGNQLSGFSVVNEYNAGSLIPHISSIQIKLAIDKIESDYTSHAKNAKKISKDFDARQALHRFIEKELL